MRNFNKKESVFILRSDVNEKVSFIEYQKYQKQKKNIYWMLNKNTNNRKQGFQFNSICYFVSRNNVKFLFQTKNVGLRKFQTLKLADQFN